MTKVVGVDSSTQSTKVVVCDAATGQTLADGRASHPDGTEVHPDAWWEALGVAASELLGDVEALAVGGQQHGMVTVDASGDVVRPALLWNDTRSAAAAEQLVADLGGPEKWATAVGSVPVAAITVSKVRWLADAEPEATARVRQLMLPHDWLTWRLLGRGRAVTDRGDASGTGYWSPRDEGYREDLLALALRGRSSPQLPEVLPPQGVAGVTSGEDLGPAGITIAAGTGDNMAAALGLGTRPGDVVVSLGTSGTAFAVSSVPAADPSGAVAGFADATGAFLPLVCTLNAARVLGATARMIGTDLDGLDRLALQAPPGAGGLVLLPYLDGERTPNLPDASGSLVGLTRASMTPENLARAAVEGMLCGLADGVDALRAQGVEVQRVLLIGGAARSAAVRQCAAEIFGVPVVVPPPGEYVALGAAKQAAWALGGGDLAPAWPEPSGTVTIEAADPTPGRTLREAYGRARERLHG